MNRTTMETPRLLLRPWEDADAEALYRYASDPLVGPPAGWDPHRSVEESLKIIRTVLGEEETYAVVLKETGEPIGSVGLSVPRTSAGDGKKALELGYWVARPYWGQGIIPEASAILLQRAFEVLCCDRVWCAFFDGNLKSARVQEKCGFVFDHTELVHWTGEERIEHYSLLTRDQWQRGLICRRLSLHEMPEAMELAWEVFSRCLAPGLSAEGTETFRSFVSDPALPSRLEGYGAFENGEPVGMLCMRDGKHISLFFVREDRQKQGIGSALLEALLRKHPGTSITVHAASEAVGAYEKLGFVPLSAEKLEDGIRFTPMLREPTLRFFPTETERLRLRFVEPADEAAMLSYLSDAETVAFEPYEPFTPEDFREELAYRIHSPHWIALERKSDARLIGHLYLGELECDALELGYIISRTYWHQGYGFEACSALIRQLLAQGWHRIEASCDPLNPASWRLLEKLGFRREAYLRRNVFFRRDENYHPIWKDTYIYSLLNPAETEDSGKTC